MTLMNLLQTRRKRRPLGMCFLDDEGGEGGGAGGGESQTTSWRDALPDDMRNHPSFTDIPDISTLAKSYLSSQSMIGMDKVAIPKDSADPLWDEVFKKLGRPETPEGYELKRPENYPQGLDFSDDFAKHMEKLAFDSGLSKTQLEKLVGGYTDYYETKYKEMESFRETSANEGIASLKTEWGAAFDQNLNLAKNAVKAYASPELVEFLETTGMGNDPKFIKLFANIGKTITEDSSLQGGGSSFIPTPEHAKNQIVELKTDEQFMKAYMDKHAVGHKEAVIRMQNLFKLAYPEQAPGQ